ncbi:MAG TPA: hypothetical protein VJZ26_02055 [Blastocatellia bacterium]|nr:hypothetical protein [Blastocatellia bacterium]
MRLNNLRRTISGAALTMALTLGVMIASSTSAQAQYRDYNGRDSYQQQWSRERVKDYAFKLAYHNAYSDAERIDRGRRRVSYRDMPGYNNYNTGYLSWMGYQNDYHEAYRRGYEAGFNESIQGRQRRYDREDVERVLGRDLERTYEGEGRRDDWRDRGDNRGGRNDIARIAQQNGYRDGLNKGEEDRSRRRGSNYERDSRYRDALSGYRSEFGNRDYYRQAYREGFRRGYDEAYRRNNDRGRWPF